MKFCLSVVVNHKYEKYIPYFIWSSLRSYPECNVKIFFIGNISPKTKTLTSALKEMGDFEIIENFFDDLPRSNQELKTFRWLIPSKYFLKDEYVYVGDVDLLICKENPTLLNQHISHCTNNALPYSNCIRPNAKRMSGLHFFKAKEYFEEMDEIISLYSIKLKNRKLGLQKNKVRNEEILYKMILDSKMGFPEEKERIDISGSGPHHGLHLGIWRGGSSISAPIANQIFRDSYLQHYQFFSKISKDKIFSVIDKSINLKEIQNMKIYFSKIKS